MTREEKELLLKDLCGRIQYGIIVNIPHVYHNEFKAYIKAINPEREIVYYKICGSSSPLFDRNILGIKPYLRPLSSMTEEERKEYKKIAPGLVIYDGIRIPNVQQIDWLNAHHFDYRGLIEKGLALVAPDGMYN